jgi:hypothetical protein
MRLVSPLGRSSAFRQLRHFRPEVSTPYTFNPFPLATPYPVLHCFSYSELARPIPLTAALLPAQPPADSLITSNHQPTRRRDLAAPSRQASHERPEPFRPDNMHCKRDRRGVRVERCGRAIGRRGKNLSASFEDIEWLSDDRG